MYENKSLLIWVVQYQNMGTRNIAATKEINRRVIRHCCCQLIAQLENHSFSVVTYCAMWYRRFAWNRMKCCIQFGTNTNQMSDCLLCLLLVLSNWKEDGKKVSLWFSDSNINTLSSATVEWNLCIVYKRIHDVYDGIYDDDRQKSDVNQIRP